MKQLDMFHDTDPKEKILEELGDHFGFQLMSNQILVAVYLRPEKTKGGVILSDRYRDEDRFQSKVGLLLDQGPSAFVEDGDASWFGKYPFKKGDWVVFRPSDGWSIHVNGVLCRILSDAQVKGVVDNPDRVW
jgi:co-chaperonin GroES (HSP10)